MTVGMKDDAAKPDYSLLPVNWSVFVVGGVNADCRDKDLAGLVYVATREPSSARDVGLAVTEIIDRLGGDGKATFPAVELALVRVLEFGAVKYSRDNWQVVDNAVVRYCAAARRHFSAWAQCGFGDAVAEDSGLPHWAHLLANLTFLAWFKGQA